MYSLSRPPIATDSTVRPPARASRVPIDLATITGVADAEQKGVDPQPDTLGVGGREAQHR